MSEVRVPWAVWSEEEPSSEVMVAYRAYLRLAGELGGSSYRRQIEAKRRRDAWVWGHVRAGRAEAEAAAAWADLERRRLAERRRLIAEIDAERAAEREREAAVWERRRRERELVLAAARAARDERRVEMQGVFARVGGRGRWCLIERRRGRTFAAIGRDGGLSGTRVMQLCAKEERLERRRGKWWQNRVWSQTSLNRGRPVDMGGPRGVWLHFGPPADPRLDNREPV